jgi:hypothetical protein
MANQILSNHRMNGAYPMSLLMWATPPTAVGMIRKYNVTSGGSDPVAESQATTEPVVATVFYTERLAADYEILATDTLSITTNFHYVTTDPGAKVRLHLFRVTQSTQEETLIGTVESGTLDGTSSKDTFTFAIPRNIQCAKGERLLLRIWIVPVGATFTATATVNHRYGHTTSSDLHYGILNCPAGMTWIPNRTRFYLHRDASAVGGTFFLMDTTLSTFGTFTTGVVNTTAGGTQIQWTRTAGGTVLHWISARFKDGWRLAATGISVTAAKFDQIAFFESATAANVGVRMKLFRWRAGVETEALSLDYATELTTSSTVVVMDDLNASNVVFPTTDFLADDRLVVRAYIIPAGGTMGGSRTATLEYDSNVSGDRSYLDLFETTLLKDESDPAEPPGTPGAMTMTGMGN